MSSICSTARVSSGDMTCGGQAHTWECDCTKVLYVVMSICSSLIVPSQRPRPWSNYKRSSGDAVDAKHEQRGGHLLFELIQYKKPFLGNFCHVSQRRYANAAHAPSHHAKV